MSRLAQLIRYSSKVYDLRNLLKRVQDSRDKSRTQIPTPAVLLAWVIAFNARVRSREEIGRYLDRRAVQQLVGCHISSDSLGRILGQLQVDSIRTELLVPLVRQMRRNKAWQSGSIAGQVLVGIDGSEAFASRRHHCPQCLAREIQVNGAKVTEYYHRAVWAYLIGAEPGVFLDVELLQPDEGEVAAATRLVGRIAKHYGRWIDGVVADAGFARAPFLNHVRSLGLHYMVRVKGESRYVIHEGNALCAQRSPDASWQQRIGHRHLQIAAWDHLALRSWSTLDTPVRLVVCDETELPAAPYRRRRCAEPEHRRPRAFFATSYPRKTLDTSDICRAYHRRWDIENAGIRQLKHEWHWDHPFVHTPAALQALWLLLAVAANLFRMFVGRRLCITRSGGQPDCSVAEAIAADLIHLTVTTVTRLNSS